MSGGEVAPQGSGPQAKVVDPGPVVEAIRARSAEAKLLTLEELAARFPENDLAASIAAAGAPDLESIAGKAAVYWFSALGMTRAYATHLARVEEGDPVKLVAEVVREESRTYPRPTPLDSFANRPFGLSKGALSDILESLGVGEETADIRVCRSSNGAVYLYSTRYLTQEHAEGLAEWDAVERWNNP